MTNALKLPPGSTGLPLLGETLPFLSDMFGFIHRKTLQHGPVFRSSILGQKTVFLSGPSVMEQWLDPALVERRGAVPGSLLQLFGGNPDIVPLLDGDAFLARKALLLSAFSREAVASYLPRLQRSMEALFARWAARGEGPVTADLKSLAIEAIVGSVLSMEPGAELDALRADYAVLFTAATALPLPLPGTAFTAGLKAVERILARLTGVVRAHLAAAGAAPKSDGGADGLTRILAARTAAGEQLSPETAAREMHHFVLAGVIVYGELVALLVQLDRHPEVQARLRAEVRAASPSGQVTPGALRQMPYLDQVVMELKRLTPIVPMSFGRAKADLHFGEFVVPRGWLLMVGVGESNRTANYTAPDTFDPDRFSEARKEQDRHPHAFTPQGAGTLAGHHKCAGYDYSTVVIQLFAVALLRDHAFSLPAQELAMNPKAIPPEYRNGLVVRFNRP